MSTAPQYCRTAIIKSGPHIRIWPWFSLFSLLIRWTMSSALIGQTVVTPDYKVKGGWETSDIEGRGYWFLFISSTLNHRQRATVITIIIQGSVFSPVYRFFSFVKMSNIQYNLREPIPQDRESKRASVSSQSPELLQSPSAWHWLAFPSRTKRGDWLKSIKQ